MKNFKKTLAFFLIILNLVGSFALNASAAWRTGNYGKGYTTVYLKNTKKDGYIKVHTYTCKSSKNHTGKCKNSKETKDKLVITLKDTRGRWICSFDTKGKSKLKLGKDHDAYRIYISPKTSLDIVNQITTNHWGIETISNTKF